MSVLTPEQVAIKAAAPDFVAQNIVPQAAAFDRSGEFNRYLLDAAKSRKIFAMAVPKEFGGLGYDALTQALVLEERGYGCGATGTTLAASILSLEAVLIAGNDDQRRRYFAPLVAGGIGAAIAKAFCTDMATRVTAQAVSLRGRASRLAHRGLSRRRARRDDYGFGVSSSRSSSVMALRSSWRASSRSTFWPRQRLWEVFELEDGGWRGIARVPSGNIRLRRSAPATSTEPDPCICEPS
jgi:alkylation response protein AidB-like acyl-CoA dehydrogenase